MPAMSQRFLELEAAAFFGVTLDKFLRCEMHRRVEMMAHVIIRKQRESYVEHVMYEWMDRKAKRNKGGNKRPGRNPLADMHKMWGIKS